MQDVVLAALTRGPGGWHLDPTLAAKLPERLEVLARRAPDPAVAARPVLKLIAVLEADGAWAAAEGLMAVLRATPTVYEALRQAKVRRGTGPRQAGQRLATFEGRAGSVSAPRYDSPAPQGTLPARNLVRPLDAAAVRAKKR